MNVRRLVTIGAALGSLAVPPVSLRAADIGQPAHDYLLSCGGCHGLDGSGSVRVPSLRGVDRLLARPGGRDYVLRVPGVASAPLSDARLAALLDWVFTHFDNRTPTEFNAAEVGAARAAPWLDPKAARAALD
jgi:mono/diheme cytochrome c family protein